MTTYRRLRPPSDPASEDPSFTDDDGARPEAPFTESGHDQDPVTLPIRDRRSAPRFMFQVPVLIRMAHQSGRGKVHDMSSTGVRIENANLEPTEGTKVRLGFRFFENSPPIELTGHVVRKTNEGGFCVHFASLDPRTRRALTTLLPKLATGRCEEGGGRLYSGELVTRLGPELHRACAEAAHAAGLTLNDWIKKRLDEDAREELESARSDPPPPVHDGPARNPYRR